MRKQPGTVAEFDGKKFWVCLCADDDNLCPWLMEGCGGCGASRPDVSRPSISSSPSSEPVRVHRPGETWEHQGAKYWACTCDVGFVHSWPEDRCLDCKTLRPVGMKFDTGKPDWTLMPWDGLAPVLRVLELGAIKYERDNWRKVPNSTERYKKALMRHVIAYASGEELDPETGENHLAHVVCCGLFILGKRESP